MQIVKAYAKINLFLDIEGKRDDGYHDICSIMQTVSLHDLIEIGPNGQKNGITFGCDDEGIPCDSSNLAVRAAEEFIRQTGCIVPGLGIYLHKRIPHAAGLAGGSADAAAVLRYLRDTYMPDMDDSELAAAGRNIGADVPFCIRGGTCVTRGIGDLITPLPDIPDMTVVIAKGSGNVGTPSAYRELDVLHREGFGPVDGRFGDMCRSIAEGNFSGICGNIYNIFEETAAGRSPDVLDIKKRLAEAGAVCSLLSGSGPSVFGIFSDREKAETAKDSLAGAGHSAFVCAPCGIGD